MVLPCLLNLLRAELFKLLLLLSESKEEARIESAIANPLAQRRDLCAQLLNLRRQRRPLGRLDPLGPEVTDANGLLVHLLYLLHLHLLHLHLLHLHLVRFHIGCGCGCVLSLDRGPREPRGAQPRFDDMIDGAQPRFDDLIDGAIEGVILLIGRMLCLRLVRHRRLVSGLGWGHELRQRLRCRPRGCGDLLLLLMLIGSASYRHSLRLLRNLRLLSLHWHSGRFGGRGPSCQLGLRRLDLASSLPRVAGAKGARNDELTHARLPSLARRVVA